MLQQGFTLNLSYQLLDNLPTPVTFNRLLFVSPPFAYAGTLSCTQIKPAFNSTGLQTNSAIKSCTNELAA